MHTYLVIFLGGGFGSLCRFYLSTLVNKNSSTFFPLGTLVVNLIGCFLIGLLFEIFDRIVFSVEIRTLLTIGFLGGFTTFSTYMIENSNMIRLGEYRYFLINLFVQNIGGLFFAFLGILLVRISIKFIMR